MPYFSNLFNKIWWFTVSKALEKSIKVANDMFVLLIAVNISCVNSETEFIVELFFLNPPCFLFKMLLFSK